jgi:hypothetical protein
MDERERALNLITQSKAINIVRVLVFFSVLFSFSLPQTECDSVCREEEEEDKIEKQNQKGQSLFTGRLIGAQHTGLIHTAIQHSSKDFFLIIPSSSSFSIFPPKKRI